MAPIFRVLAIAIAALSVHCRDLPVSSTIASFLSTNGLPPGLFPTTGIEKFEVRNNGTFLVEMRDVCQSEEMDEQGLFFDSRISGSFGRGRMYGLYGVWLKRSFQWLPVTSIDVSKEDDHVVFQVGMFEHRFPATKFQDEITCDRRKAIVGNDTSSFFEDYVYGVFRRAFGGI